MDGRSRKQSVWPCDWTALLTVVGSILLSIGGCQRQATAPSTTPTSAAASPTAAVDAVVPTAEELLRRMAAAYRDAPSYSDQGRIRLRYRERGELRQDEAPLSVATSYPGRLRLEAYHALVVCDGDKLYAQLRDEMSGNIDGQILVRPIADEIKLDDLYHDPVLKEALTTGLGRQPMTLDLLFGEEPLASILAEGVARRLLEPAELEGRMCRRVEAVMDAGPFVFWIDQESYLLRRLEYPVASIVPELATGEGISEVELVAEFRGAAIKPAPDSTLFVFQPPAGAKLVRAFVLPPHPLPSQMFGQQPAEFAFHRLDGTRLTSSDLAGKISVLFWFNNHPACRATLEQLNQVYQQQTPDAAHEIVAISTDPSNVSNEQVVALLKAWNIEVPAVRDLDACGRDIFQIPWAPTLVVLGGNNTVQIFEVGANPNMARELPVILERLADGADLAAEIVAQQAKDQDAYARLLASASGEGDSTMVELALANIQPRSDPSLFQITSKWTSDEVQHPGNMLILAESGPEPTLLVLNDYQSVVEVTAAGQRGTQHDLQLDGQRVGFLRTAVNSTGGRLFLASAIQGQFACLFDQEWRRILKYPADAQTHPGISDAQLADLTEDGVAEVVLAFAGTVGVQCVDLQGTRTWTNRTMPNVLSVAVTSKQDETAARLFVTGERGDILEVDASGQQQAPIAVAGRQLFHLFASGFTSEGGTPFCGLTYSQAGNLVAIGLDAKFGEVWNYPLPLGTFRNPLQFVTTGRIADQDFWCLAAPDGSIHLVRSDGHVADRFNSGLDLTGLRLHESTLYFASPGKLAALEVAARQTTPSAAP